jgi:hypothetical protein
VDESRANHPEQDPDQDEDQHGKAGRLVGHSIDIRRHLGKQAQERQDPSGGEPHEPGVPLKEQ